MAQMLNKSADAVDAVCASCTDPEYEAWFRRKVKAGEQAYMEGCFISQEEETRRAEVRHQILRKMLAR